MIRFTEDHEWVKVDGSEAVVGISDHAQGALGDITYVELPEVGSFVHMGDILGTVESVKAASDIFAPISGKVVAVNEKLSDTPELINDSAEGDGWICRLAEFDAAQIEILMTAEQYKAHCQ